MQRINERKKQQQLINQLSFNHLNSIEFQL